MPHDVLSPVKISGLLKRYGANEVIRGMDLELEPGRFYAILGRNGSGKSTLMRILAHRETASGGEAEVLGVGLEEDFGARASQLAFIAEGSVYPPEATVQMLLPLHQAVFPTWNEEVAVKLLREFGVNPSKTFGELSRGQLVQVAVSFAFGYGPRLFLLDEVTSVLDARARAILLRELRQRAKAGATVLLSTNIVSEVQGIADAYVLLGEKRIKVNAPAAELVSSFVKLAKRADEDHPVFRSEHCVEVGLTAGGDQLLFLMPKSDFSSVAGAAQFAVAEPVTASEVFIYLSALRD